MRHHFVLIHRYVGLVMAMFLVIIGLTGSVLSFYTELDNFVLGLVFQAPRDIPGGIAAKRLSPYDLRNKVISTYPQLRVNQLDLSPAGYALTSMAVEPAPDMGKALPELAYDEIFLNAYTGEILGARKWGDISQGWKNLIPFLYKLHTSLAMGTPGLYILGIIALFWTIDCFIGAYLTFPARRNRQKTAVSGNSHKSWISRWWKAWKIRWKSGSYKALFDLHRAGGLWPWAMLFVLAWSSVAMNLQEVYKPVMSTFFTMQATEPEFAGNHPPVLTPKIGWHQAPHIAQQLMLEQAVNYHFDVIRPQSLSYDPATVIYQYRVLSSLDVADRYGSTSISFDANSGAFKSIYLPTGKHNGETVTNWLFALHMAGLWGLPYKALLCLIGLMIVALSVTGIYIWWKKRYARKFARR